MNEAVARRFHVDGHVKVGQVRPEGNCVPSGFLAGSALSCTTGTASCGASSTNLTLDSGLSNSIGVGRVSGADEGAAVADSSAMLRALEGDRSWSDTGVKKTVK